MIEAGSARPPTTSLGVQPPWPCEREACVSAVTTPNLAAAWTDSAKRIRDIGSVLADGLPEFVACVAVSGSLARMEGHAYSDIDLVVVVDDRNVAVSDDESHETITQVWDRLDSLNAVRPKPGGIFSVCARWKNLLDPAARGRIDESVTTFGHRIQLLMDAQPVFSPDRFTELRRDILTWYSEHRLAAMFDEPGRLHWLWQDVQRYWRSLRARTCWLDADSPNKSLLLNVKLRSSRLTLVFATLKTIQIAHHVADNQVVPSLLQSLHKTPLERLFGDHSHNSQSGLAAYETIWSFLRDNAADDVRDLPCEVGQALNTLSDAVAAQITSHSASDLRPWIL